MNPIALVSANVRFRKSSSGRIGSAARASTNGKSTSRPSPTTIIDTIAGEPQSYVVPPRLVKSTIDVRAPARTAAPR